MIHLIAATLAIIAVCVGCKKKFEESLPAVFLSAMVLLTVLAMLGKLSWVDALAILVIAGVLLVGAYSLLSKRISAAELGGRFLRFVTTPGLCCFILLAAFFAYATKDMAVWWGDDILQWAISPKSLWAFDGLVEEAKHLSPAFASYTPGMQVLQWWAMRAAGQWGERWLFFTLFMSYAVFLLPFCAKLNWKTLWLAPVVILAYPVWGNALSYLFLSVDTALALCFGYALIQAWQSRKGDAFHRLCLLLGLCALILIKQTGLLFAYVVVFIFLAVKGFPKGKVFYLLAPLVVWGGWMAFCAVMGLSGLHTSEITGRFAQLLSGAYVPPPGAQDLPGALWFGATAPITDKLLLGTAPVIHVPRLLWIGLTVAFLWLLAWKSASRELKRISLLLTVAVLGYLAVQFFSFYTIFYEETLLYATNQPGKMVLLMERYLSPLVLGMGMLSLWLAADMLPKPMAALWKPLPWASAAVCALVFALTTNWGVLADCLLPARYLQQDRSMGVETVMMMDHDWGTLLEGYENAHVLVGFDPNSDYLNNLRYVYAPVRFDSSKGPFTKSAETLSAYLSEQKITHIICFDDTAAIIGPAQELMEDEDFYPWTLYEVQHLDGKVVLAEYD